MGKAPSELSPDDIRHNGHREARRKAEVWRERELGGVAPRVRPEGMGESFRQVVARAIMREKCTEKSRIISGEKDKKEKTCLLGGGAGRSSDRSSYWVNGLSRARKVIRVEYFAQNISHFSLEEFTPCHKTWILVILIVIIQNICISHFLNPISN